MRWTIPLEVTLISTEGSDVDETSVRWFNLEEGPPVGVASFISSSPEKTQTIRRQSSRWAIPEECAAGPGEIDHCGQNAVHRIDLENRAPLLAPAFRSCSPQNSAFIEDKAPTGIASVGACKLKNQRKNLG